MLQLIILCLLSLLKVGDSANILHVSAMPSPSHHIWNRALALELVGRGHNVTFLGPDKDPGPTKYTHIHLEGFYDFVNETFDLNEMSTYGSFKMMRIFQEWCTYICNLSLKSKALQTILNYPDNFFDLIIFDATQDSCWFPLLHKFNYPPAVAVTPFLLPAYLSHKFGNHLYPGYVPWWNLAYNTDMNFFQRVWNTILTYLDTLIRELWLNKLQHELAKEFFGSKLPTMEELERRVSLLLANSDPVLDYPQPVPPNIILVGGLHTRPSKKLPQDLQTLLDASKHGAIIFSLGTNVRSDKLDYKIQRVLLDTFAKIPQTVIWKFESEIKDLPPNVIVRKWLPQNDLLGHPNVKLFIGHGGCLSTQEAVFHGVPLIAIPFFADQYVNAKRVVDRRIGVFLDFKKIKGDYVSRILKEALNNPEYKDNMQKLSTMYKDRLETPLERAAFWTEYVIRNKGAPLLSTHARNIPLYKSSSLDVHLFLIFHILAALFILYKFVKLILSKVCNKKKLKTN